MCGVAGIVDFQGRNNNLPIVKSMLSSINYRGPDESGIYNSRFATIGNVRLSIIDLAGGQQPLSDPLGRFWIVFNGEIFNYKELREQLEKKGSTFKTHSDTEVLVQLYARYGKDCLSMLNGQFAVAIWDKKEEELFIARDRVGIRPLFFNITNGVFSFASEMKSLFQNYHISRELIPESLSQVFTFWTTITPATVFKGISELSPGHYLVYNQKGLRTEKFWQLEMTHKNRSLSIDDAVEQFDELFSSSVRLRLRADVEVAAYLSGGLDSSATVSYIKKIEPGVLNTFSISFTEKDFDETSYQKEAVKYYNTNHRSVLCTPKNIADLFPRVVWQSETPLTRTAPTPMLILSKLVRESNIKVVITGEGSDEIFAGYDIFREAKIRRFWATQPQSKYRPLLLKKIYPDIPHLRDSNPNILKMFFGYKLSETDNLLYSHLLRWNNSNHIKKHFSADLKGRLSNYSPLEEIYKILPVGFDKWDDLAKAQWLETTIFMSGYLLSSQGDRMGMANSIEGRYPFLDYRIIEFCSGLPSDYKLKGLNEKYLLKKVMKNNIPVSILNRPKQPYRAPIKSVFLSKNSPEYVREMLSESCTLKAGIFNYESFSPILSRIAKTDLASEVDNMTLTTIISTHLLYHQFIENNNEEFRMGPLKNLRIIDDSYKN
jgi:asparagine synthase (glutamine-hydrolysing)